MKRRIFTLGALAALATGGCSSKNRPYNGPEVTSIVVKKGERRMYLLHHDQVIKNVDFDLGFSPVGHKQIEGDGRTPEGVYFIDRRNPNSQFHLSLGISYPSPRDIEVARAFGKSPGGDIFIHGQPNKDKAKGRDWTAGCIAIKNREIEELYAMVRDGTPIYLQP